MIYLVLHGETEWNRQRRFQGRLDSPLTPEGLEQANRVGIALSRIVENVAGCQIVSSPLGRARHTAEVICEKLKMPPTRLVLDPRLMEIDLGSWAGLTRANVEERWPRPLEGANRYDWYFRSPDGERLDAVTARLRQWLTDTANSGAITIAVTHGIASRILRGLYACLSMEQALSLEISRDAIFRLANRKIEKIECT